MPPDVEKFPPYILGDSDTCHGSKAIGLTADKTPIRTALQNLQIGYGTSIWEGAAWGFRMLSPKWRGKWGNPDLPLDYGKDHRKVAVIMTDGENTPEDYGDPFNTATANQMMIDTCGYMKAAGITVYTVAFNVSARIAAPLKECASGDNFFFNPPSNDGLLAAFAKIGADLTSGEARLIE